MIKMYGSGSSWRMAGAAAAFAALMTAAAPAQTVDFTGTDWFEREIGEGVTWRYYQFDNLFGAKQSVSWIEADLDDANIEVEFPYLAASRTRTSTMIPSQFPAAVGGVNGTYFDTSAGGGGATTYLRINGSEINAQSGGAGNTNMRHQAAISRLMADGTIEIIDRPGDNDWLSNTTHEDVMANGPRLQSAGTIPDMSIYGAHCTNRHPRTAVGMTADNRIILVTVDGRTSEAAGMTCNELALVMEELGCVDSLNMDGGGSTTMWAAGEPENGVVNFPSDNGQYDHAGERSASNAIAIVAPAVATPAAYDARLTAINFASTMIEETTQTVTLTYENIGTQTWTAADTELRTSRPEARASVFETTGWVSSSQPAAMSPATVAPGGTASFTFDMEAPDVSVPTLYEESFALYQDGVGRFGPPDNEASIDVFVELPVGSNVIVESRRPDGSLTPAPAYSEPAGSLSNTTSKSAVTNPAVVGSGARYTATVGRRARFQPTLPEDGLYNVYVTLGAGSNNNANASYVIGNSGPDVTGSVHLTHADGSLVNQWKLLESNVPFDAGSAGYIEFTNVDGNAGSGARFVSDAVRFELVTITAVDSWSTY